MNTSAKYLLYAIFTNIYIRYNVLKWVIWFTSRSQCVDIVIKLFLFVVHCCLRIFFSSLLLSRERIYKNLYHGIARIHIDLWTHLYSINMYFQLPKYFTFSMRKNRHLFLLRFRFHHCCYWCFLQLLILLLLLYCIPLLIFIFPYVPIFFSFAGALYY